MGGVQTSYHVTPTWVEVGLDWIELKLVWMLGWVVTNRQRLGKCNIITFLINDENQGIEKKDINKVLRIAGFNVGDVEGIKLNDFRYIGEYAGYTRPASH